LKGKQKPCLRCGALHNADYTLCYQCYLWSVTRAQADRETEIMAWENDLEQPSSEWCVMCGQEWGTSLRADNKYYCATCWTIWNS